MKDIGKSARAKSQNALTAALVSSRNLIHAVSDLH